MRKFCLHLFVLFVFSVPWQNAISIGGSSTLSMYLGIAAVSVTVAVCLAERRVRRLSSLLIAYSVYVLWQLTTYFWSLDQSATLEVMRTLVQLVGMIWLVRELCSRDEDRLMVMQGFVAGCVVVCAVLIWAYASGQAMDGYRYAPVDFSLNGAADTLAIGIALAVIVCSTVKSRVLFWLNLAYVPLAVFSVVLTASRSGFAATCLACTGIVVLLRNVRSVVRPALMVVILGVSIGMFLALQGSQRLEANIDRLLLANETYSVHSLSGRTEIWAAGATAFAERPFTGSGLGVFPLAVQDQLGLPRPAHNLFVQVAAESGLVGVACLAAVLVCAITPALRRRKDWGLYLVLFLVAMVMAFVANVQTNKTFWLVMALLALASPPVARQPLSKEASEDALGRVRELPLVR